jgi:hypothetical protein
VHIKSEWPANCLGSYVETKMDVTRNHVKAVSTFIASD